MWGWFWRESIQQNTPAPNRLCAHKTIKRAIIKIVPASFKNNE